MKRKIFTSFFAIALVFNAVAQVKDISFAIAPTTEYVLWNKKSAIENGFMVGGYVGFGFGRNLELLGSYSQSLGLKSRIDGFSAPDNINNPNVARTVAKNDLNVANYVAKNDPNEAESVANNSNKDILLQKQLDTIAKSIKDLSDQQKLLAAAMIPLTTLNNKDKLDNIQQRTDSILLLSKKQADQNNVQAPKETSVIVQNVKTPEHNVGNSVISEERGRTLEDLLAKYGNKKTPIYFANNAYVPLPHDTDAIDQIVTMLRNNPELSILLEGYASNMGTAAYNNQLSMKRSESVACLLQKQGIALQRILTAFRGIDDSVDKEKARRVDISVIIR